MTIYLILIILLCFLIAIYDVRKKQSMFFSNNKKLWYLFCLSYFIAIPIFSFKMGTDTAVYEYWFNKELRVLGDFSFNDSRWEPLFCLMMSLLKTITNSWFIAHSIIIFFINIFVFNFGRKYVNSFFTFLLLYFLIFYYEYNFEAIRQSIAMCIFFSSLKFLKKENYGRYYLSVFIAIGFHYVSVIMFLFPLLKRIKFGLYVYLFFISLLFIGELANLYFPDMIQFLNTMGDVDLYNYYLDSDLGSSMLNANGRLLILLIGVVPIIISVHVVKNLTLPFYQPLAFLFVTSEILYTYIQLLDRFVQYFGIIQVCLCAELLLCRIRTIRVFNTCIPVCLLKVYVIIALLVNIIQFYNYEDSYGVKNIQRIVPYVSIWS